MSTFNLDNCGESLDDATLAYEQAYSCYDDDADFHAPSDYVAYLRGEHERMRLRDLNELQDLWREEEQRRKRERARVYYRAYKRARGGRMKEE
jgi:hypothetical protein